MKINTQVDLYLEDVFFIAPMNANDLCNVRIVFTFV